MYESLVKFADRINEYLNEYEMTQVALANRIGYSKQTINSWCAGKSTPIFGDVPSIAEKMGVSVAWLMGFENASMRNNTPESVEFDEVAKKKIIDQEVMDNAPRMEVNGSLMPVYSEEQLTKRLEMISRAFDMFLEQKIEESTLKLIINSLR